MRGRFPKIVATLMASGLLVLVCAPLPTRADDSSFFGRLFRLGGNSTSTSASTSKPSSSANSGGGGSFGSAGTQGSASAFGDIGNGGSFYPSGSSGARLPSATPATGAIPSEGPSTPAFPSSADSQPRISPRPRVSNAVTSADPLLTRMAVGRSNDGAQFGMLLQVFTDGTVIDSDGVHRLSTSDLRPLIEAVQNSELARVRGHCGTPSGDYIEYVHIVVFERRMGRLQAHAFSYAGNPQGCDNGIRRLHSALENLQAKISRQAVAGSSPAAAFPAPLSGAANPGAFPRVGGSSPTAAIPLDRPAMAPPLPDPAAGTGPSPGGMIPLSPSSPR